LAQLDLPQGEIEHNLDAAEKAVQQAADQTADIVLLPALWASGYDLKNSPAYASPLDGGHFSFMSSLASSAGIALGGSLIEERGGNFFNTFVFLNKTGDQIGAYQKIHLFNFLEEDKYLTGGTHLVLVDSPWGKIGLAVCYDLRFPEMFRTYALQGAEIIFLVAEWPRKRISHWDILLQARAVENQCFLAGVNKVGKSMGAPLGGRSAVVDPLGNLVVQGDESEAVLIADVELDRTSETRRWMPVLTDRNPKAYQ
jgi:predicted amidohydrolase